MILQHKGHKNPVAEEPITFDFGRFIDALAALREQCLELDKYCDNDQRLNGCSHKLVHWIDATAMILPVPGAESKVIPETQPSENK